MGKGGIPIVGTAEEKKQLVAEAQEGVSDIKLKLQQLREGTLQISGDLPGKPSVGDIGRIWTGVRVAQVIDKSHARVSYGGERDNDTTVWISGTDTTDFADDATIKLDYVWEVTGTKTYTTVLGSSKTIFVLEPFDLKRLVPYIKIGEDKPAVEKRAKAGAR